MATVALNTFRTKPFQLTTAPQVIYTTPAGFTTIVLGASAGNYGTVSANITFTLIKSGIEYVMLNNFTIPINDSAEVTTGKLVIEAGASIKASASVNGTVNLVLSILETSNE